MDWSQASDIQAFVTDNYRTEDKNRMHARLFDNMGIDSWMTFELMGAAIERVIQTDFFKGAKLKTTKRDVWSSTTARVLELHDEPVDHFYNFQSIRIDQQPATFRHRNRPDGMFEMELATSTGAQNMVLFYEGDKHTKDSGKTLDQGCRNSHKMYQYFAQSQSFNPKMAACTIITSIDRAFEDFITFLNDLFKAHMFAFAVIAHYNMAKDRKKTCLHKLLDLDEGDYDFIFGINMGLTSDEVSFKTDFFDDRMGKLSNFNAQNLVINITNEMKIKCVTSNTTLDIGLVRIVFIAVPREPKEFILNQIPFFIYPMHVSKLVRWEKNGRRKDRAQVDKNELRNILRYSAGVPQQCRFRKNMMHVTNVLQIQNHGLDDQSVCTYDDTTGFFFIALPLAYYTIQQFEVVNDYLKYNWSKKSVNFNSLFDDFMDSIYHSSNSKIKVRMFKDDKSQSLFHQICESTDSSTDDIDEDFKLFLRESCRWKEVDGQSPVIFFRIMRIYSLQNAIDFAFEVQRSESKTYLNLLSSYPIGTQILIRQCMKKLTDVTAFAYLNRETSTPKPTEDTAKNDSDDEEPSFTNFLVQKLLDAKDAVMNYMQSTVWEVYFEQSYQVVNENINLLGEYKKVIKEWEYVENPSNDQKQNVVEDMNQKFRKEYDRLRKNTEKKMNIEGVDITCADMVVKFLGAHEEAFHYQPILPTEFLCSEAGINATIRTDNVDRVTLLWGQKRITFRKASQDRTDEIETSMNTGNTGNMWSMLTGSRK
jgi:hypothetical protein